MRFGALSLLFWAGCSPSAKYTFTSSTTALSPKPKDCDFAVMTAAPASGYQEIGILDWQSGWAVDKVAFFKSSVHDQVCMSGGDLVVTEINGVGDYVRGAVLRKITALEGEKP
jgi:hypothetical protein